MKQGVRLRSRHTRAELGKFAEKLLALSALTLTLIMNSRAYLSQHYLPDSIDYYSPASANTDSYLTGSALAFRHFAGLSFTPARR
jgi:hypothetical protein